MHVLIAPDKFRGSLSAGDAAEAMAVGVRNACGGVVSVTLRPMADGGEGTLEALCGTGGRMIDTDATGPLGEPVRATYGLMNGGRTAVIEMALVSGLALIGDASRRDPFRTTTRGTGELVRAALDSGAASIVIGIGGSATNDGGTGLARALGYRFLDAEGNELAEGGGALERLDRIDASGRDRRLDTVRIEVACDVDNPLKGPRGAAAVFGPQKFAPERPGTVDEIRRLDGGLARLAEVIERDLGVNVVDVPGAGAAGGLGAGLLAFAGGRLRPGFTIVAEAVGLDELLTHVDLCLTGEGAIDGSSAGGKTAVGVARAARARGVPCLALAGAIGSGAETVVGEGISAYFSLCDRPLALADALGEAYGLLARATEQAVRAFLAGRKGASS